MTTSPDLTGAARDSWRIGPDRRVPLDRPILMGILNVTPDSFSDGGLHAEPDSAVEAARRMAREGATIIDIGGESTRPGAERVPADEQLRRVLPVVERLREDAELALSVDTTQPLVAERAVAAGARIINDVSAGEEDGRIFAIAAECECGLVLMHRLRPPDRDEYSDRYRNAPEYEDVVSQVRDYLLERAQVAEACGVAKESIVLDPGLGFGKSVSQNFALLDGMDEFVNTGYPVLVAASRKSFLGSVTGVENPADRVAGSVAASVLAFGRGARLFRVHDVGPHREGLAVAAAAREASKSG